MRKECLLGEIDDALETLYETVEYDMYEVEINEFDNSVLAVTGIRILVPELKVSLRQGDVCVFDPDEEEYVPDFSVSIVYEQDETDPKTFLYWEQDGFQVTLFNFFHKDLISMDALSKMKCIIEIDANISDN